MLDCDELKPRTEYAMSVPVFASIYANLHGEHGVPPDVEEKMAKEHIAELIAEFLLKKGFIQFDFIDRYPHRDGILCGVLCVRRPLGDDEAVKCGEDEFEQIGMNEAEDS